MLFSQITPPEADSTAAAIADSTKEAIEETISMMKEGRWSELLGKWTTSLLDFGKDLLVAIIIFLIGRWLIKKTLKLMDKIFIKRDVDISLRTFLKSVVNITMYIILISIVIHQLGIEATSLIAMLGAAGLAIGMALSGTMQNFAGGVIILLIKPYRIGDFIEAQGQSGTVKDIHIFNTIIRTPDNKTIYIPNGPMSTGIVNNYSRASTRRVEWIIAISYGDNFAQTQAAIRELLEAEPRIMANKGYTIEIKELADSWVNIVVRAWVKSGDYWPVFFDINSRIYKTLPEKGVQFPFPQMDVRITK